MSSVINGTDYDDNNTVNGDGQFHKSLVGQNWTINNQGQIQLSNDTIYGNKGDDILSGLAGDDLLDGGFGSDKLDGGAGNDKLYGEAGEDMLYGGAGQDFLSGGFHNDYLFGGSGKDYLIGGDGNDYLDGANFSGAGNGIGGGTESDSLAGGAGADTFVLGNVNNVYYLGTGYATITDFTLGQDKIQIKGNFADGYSLKVGEWNGNNVQDTGIFYKDNLIGVVQDQKLINVNPNLVFSSAPPVPL
ncbi:calcium-binding protein [Microcoleus sp. S36b_A3]|uniref:calcium-binding protein n=1 Tax=unclassified Microcoleus TaxID=2642155 RepID=UPI002FD73B6F